MLMLQRIVKAAVGLHERHKNESLSSKFSVIQDLLANHATRLLLFLVALLRRLHK
jgi:hypothetical protein